MGNVNLLICFYDYVNRISALKMANIRFEDKFRYDEQGVPRIWKPSDDIDGIFKSARDDVPHPSRCKVTIDAPSHSRILRNYALNRGKSSSRYSTTPRLHRKIFLHTPNTHQTIRINHTLQTSG